jgi:capsular exopolysaccharide synthesis family protein
MSQPVSITPESGTSAISLNAMVAIVRKRKWMILAIAAALPALVGFVVSKEPKIYRASTTLVIDSTVPQYLGSNFKDVVDIEANWWSAQETLQTELKVVTSYSQALAVAKALCDKRVGDTPALQKIVPAYDCAKPEHVDLAAQMLQGIVHVDPLKDSRIVTMSVDFTDPKLAALLVNTIAQVYVERNLERRLSQSGGAATWLGQQYGDLNQQVNDAERALIDFKKKYNVLSVGIEDQQNEVSSRRKKLTEELNGIEVKLIAVRAQREEYAGLRSDDPMTDIAPGASDSPVIMKVKELYVDQYAKLLEMKGKYLEKHPTVIAQEARVDAIREDLKREATLASKALEAQYQTLVKQQHDLHAALDVATKEALLLEQRAIEYNRLKRDFDRLSKLSEQVGGREGETSLAGHLNTNNIRILDGALVPSSPISPDLPRSVGVAAVVALLLAFGLAFLMEMIDSTVKSQDDIEHAAGLVFLGLVPTIGAPTKPSTVKPPPALVDVLAKDSKDLYVLMHPRSPVAECCRAIRTNILFMTPDNPAKTLLITSAGPQEGKSTTALNMAITMAQSGLKVLLVDTDMRRPRLHKSFGIPANSDGVSRAILGDVDPVSMVRETGIGNLFLLPCGALPPNPAEMLHSERFKAIVEQLRGTYDRVIFDSPPVGAVTDAAILSQLTDGTVLVAKAGHTSRQALATARRVLTDRRVNVLGCVLNDLNLEKAGSYGYYYYSRYGYYSGYGDEAAPPPSANQSEGHG